MLYIWNLPVLLIVKLLNWCIHNVYFQDFGNVMSGSDPIKSVQKKSSSSKHSSSLYTPGQEISSGKVREYILNVNFIEIVLS